MGYEVRYATADEFESVAELDGASFGLDYDADALADARDELYLDRLLVALDGERIIAVSAELPFELTLPGGGLVPVTGLTWVSVELTHRRRGVLRTLMERQVRDAAEAGLPALTLMASEGGIYGRYGFGNATVFRRTVIRRAKARFARPVDTSGVQRLSTSAAAELLPPIYDRWRRATPGGLSRGERRWALMLRDRPARRGGASPLQHLVHPDGYLSYRTKLEWDGGEPNGTCEIVDYAPVTPQAHAALWQVLLGLDLTARINSFRIPVDDPLPVLLSDPRAVDVAHVGDGTWVRPVAVPALLSGRRYGLDVDCVVEVRDEVLGDGRYRLSGGPEGAVSEWTSAPADVTMRVADLGSLVVGGERLQRLARAGVVDCRNPALLARLDLALLADRAPFHGTQF